MTIVGWQLCQNHDTPIGSPLPLVDEDGVWEDWCTFDADRWHVVNDAFVEFEAECANFGGKLRITPEPNRPSGFGGYALLNITSTERMRLVGKSLVVRVSPMEGPGRYTFLEIEDPTTGFGGNQAFVEVLANGDIEFQIIGDGIFDGSTVTYSPTDHAWWRVRHDESNGTLYIDTASFCGTWTNQVSAVVGSEWASHRPRLVQEIADPNGSEGPGFWGPIYILPTDPEPES